MTEQCPEQACLTCRLNQGAGQAPGGIIYDDGLWRLEHAITPIPLVGWLILKPLRHVEHFADLTEEEAVTVGPLTRRATQAMRQVLRPAKIYLSMYAEAPGYAHLHIHLIPRFAGTPPERRGPRVFEYMREATELGRDLSEHAAAASAAEDIRRLLE